MPTGKQVHFSRRVGFIVGEGGRSEARSLIQALNRRVATLLGLPCPSAMGLHNGGRTSALPFCSQEMAYARDALYQAPLVITRLKRYQAGHWLVDVGDGGKPHIRCLQQQACLPTSERIDTRPSA